MARATIAYLEHRYTVLEREIADALRDSPTDDRAIADLRYRKRIIANEILDNRRLVERFPSALLTNVKVVRGVWRPMTIRSRAVGALL